MSSEVETSRGATESYFRGILRPRRLSGLRMTTRLKWRFRKSALLLMPVTRECSFRKS